MENSASALEEKKLINSRLELIRQAMSEEDLPKLGKFALEKIRKEMQSGAEGIKREPEAHASDLIPTKTVKRKTREQKKATRAPTVKRRPKKSTKYNTQALFEKLAKAHQKTADSMKNGKRQSAKRRYHAELAKAYAFVVAVGEDAESDDLTRIPPLFKGALIMTMPGQSKGYY